MTLSSPAFQHGNPIPEMHSRQGGNASPPLEWTHPPAGTQSFALVVQDLDARDPGIDSEDMELDVREHSQPRRQQAAEAQEAGYDLGPDLPSPIPRTFCHWLVYGIRSDATSLDQGVPRSEKLSNGILQGQNDFSQIGYGGPEPPPGTGTHRYLFRLFALDSVPFLPPGAVAGEVDDALRGHVLEESQLIGLYRADDRP